MIILPSDHFVLLVPGAFRRYGDQIVILAARAFFQDVVANDDPATIGNIDQSAIVTVKRRDNAVFNNGFCGSALDLVPLVFRRQDLRPAHD